MSEKQPKWQNKVSELSALKKDNAHLKQEIKTLKKKIILYKKILKPRNLKLYRQCRFYFDKDAQHILM